MEGSQSVSQTEYSLVPFSSDEILRNGWLFLQSQIQRCSGHIAIPVNIVCDMVLRKYVSVIITENLFITFGLNSTSISIGKYYVLPERMRRARTSPFLTYS